MTARLAADQTALLRLVAQRIAGPGLPSAAEAVGWMTGMQAQDYNGVLTSVALRTAGGTRSAVEEALNAGEVVRSWPLRGTLHLVKAEDLTWMLRLLSPRTLARAASRRAELGLDSAALGRAREQTELILEGGHRISRTDLLARWDNGGLDTAGQRGYHLLWHLAQTGVVCFGPVADGAQQVVLVDEWITSQRRLDREEALGELAERYFCSHGPATTGDFARWANLVAADARAGLALARTQLATLVGEDGCEYHLDQGTPDLLRAHRRQARGVHLLPGFDELILGYRDRTATLPADVAHDIVPGGNGIFRPTVVSGGHVVGTWTHSGRGAQRTVLATPFTAFSTATAAAIPRAYAALP